jgi:hypothetical protein
VYVVGTQPGSIAVGDFDDDTDLDLAVANTGGGTISFLANQGNGNFAPQVAYAAASCNSVVALDLDGDLDLDLATGRVNGVGLLTNDGNGVFSAPVLVPSSTGMFGIKAADFDLDGDLDFAGTTSSTSALCVLVNQGAGVYTEAPLAVPCEGAFDVGDLDRDGDIDVAAVATAGISVLRNTLASGRSICAGDGASTACPCGNFSLPGDQAGCTNSTAAGATLRATASASLSHDRLVLKGAGMPGTAPAMYFQGSAAQAGGMGIGFGDGLFCAGGAIVRLGLVFSVGGVSEFPGVGDLSVSEKGFVTGVGERVYQVWYRDAASFCTSSTFNLSNGVVVRWGT